MDSVKLLDAQRRDERDPEAPGPSGSRTATGAGAAATGEVTGACLAGPGRFLVFRVGALEWALEVELIVGLHRREYLGRTTGIPRVGEVSMPVLDLRPPDGQHDDGLPFALELRVGQRHFALLVNEVTEVRELSPEPLAGPPDLLRGQGFVRGLAEFGDRYIFLLSLDRLTP